MHEAGHGAGAPQHPMEGSHARDSPCQLPSGQACANAGHRGVLCQRQAECSTAVSRWLGVSEVCGTKILNTLNSVLAAMNLLTPAVVERLFSLASIMQNPDSRQVARHLMLNLEQG